jgi:hypothetical protein
MHDIALVLVLCASLLAMFVICSKLANTYEHFTFVYMPNSQKPLMVYSGVKLGTGTQSGTPMVTPPAKPLVTPQVTPPVTPPAKPPVTPPATPQVTPPAKPPVTPPATPPATNPLDPSRLTALVIPEEPEVNSADNTRFISNNTLKVGFNMSMGAALCHLSTVDSTKPYAGENLVNDYDNGRLIQQSYYGDPDGSVWNMEHESRAWRWNAVQGGDYKLQSSRVESVRQTQTTFASSTIPRHWVTGALMEDVLMKQTVTLKENMVHIRFEVAYKGTKAFGVHDQELPAVFLSALFPKLATGVDDKVKIIDPPVRPSPKPDRLETTERWAAYVDDTGYGVGVCFPHATTIVYYVVRTEGAPPVSNCSYLAPVVQLPISAPFEAAYDVYIIVGHVDTIREMALTLK